MASVTRAGIDLQKRDFALLRGLFESRVMTLSHIAILYFQGKREMAKKRVQKLKAAGLLRERPRRSAERSIVFLSTSAFRLLSAGGHLSEYPKIGIASLEKRAQVSELTLRHELEVMDVKTAIVAAVAMQKNLGLIEFSTWPLLTAFEAERVALQQWGRAPTLVKPDGLIRIHESEGQEEFEHSFFLEVDRSTESQSTVAMKAACYVDHYRTGGYARRYGAERAAYQEYPFRVLMVFRNDERRNNAAERLLQNNPPIHAQIWMTTAAEIKADPLAKIWVRPVDYRDAVAGTNFENKSSNRPVYRRQPEREELVEHGARKHHLFGRDD